jgi:hypothetical protein
MGLGWLCGPLLHDGLRSTMLREVAVQPQCVCSYCAGWVLPPTALSSVGQSMSRIYGWRGSTPHAGGVTLLQGGVKAIFHGHLLGTNPSRDL